MLYYISFLFSFISYSIQRKSIRILFTFARIHFYSTLVLFQQIHSVFVSVPCDWPLFSTPDAEVLKKINIHSILTATQKIADSTDN